jgi:diphthine synthase
MNEPQEEFYGKSITLADRELVESGSDTILGEARTINVALLVIGDPFG